MCDSTEAVDGRWRRSCSSGALLLGGSSPAQGDESVAADPVVIDAGNNVEVRVNPETRLFTVTTPTPLAFESRLYNGAHLPVRGPNYFWARGWTFGTPAHAKTWDERGNSVNHFFVPRLGWYEYDPASSTGLREYPGDDVVAHVGAGWLPPRAIVGPQREYVAKVYHRDSGTTDYFGRSGKLMTSIGKGDARTDWTYAPDDYWERLPTIVHEDGSMTRMDQTSEKTYRVTGRDGRVSQILTGTGLDLFSPERFETDRGVTDFIWEVPNLPGPLGTIITREAGVRTVVEIEWDNPSVRDTIQRVLRNGRVVYPVPR